MKSEPVAFLAAAAVVLVTVVAKLGIVLETSVIETLLFDAVLVVTAIVQRSKVTPSG